jgi:hypothetical protein
VRLAEGLVVIADIEGGVRNFQSSVVQMTTGACSKVGLACSSDSPDSFCFLLRICWREHDGSRWEMMFSLSSRSHGL